MAFVFCPHLCGSSLKGSLYKLEDTGTRERLARLPLLPGPTHQGQRWSLSLQESHPLASRGRLVGSRYPLSLQPTPSMFPILHASLPLAQGLAGLAKSPVLLGPSWPLLFVLVGGMGQLCELPTQDTG